MFNRPGRIKNALWAAVIFTLIVAIPGYPEMAYWVFAVTFVLWWLVFQAHKPKIMRYSLFAIVALPVLVAIAYALYTLGFTMRSDAETIVGLMLIFGILIACIVSISAAIRIFQTARTDSKPGIGILKTVIAMIGVGILVFKVDLYLYSMDGRVITTSVSPSKKFTLVIRRRCCLICPDLVTTITLDKASSKAYSEICTIYADASQPKRSSQFKWNSDETIISWGSSDHSTGEIDLRKDCGSPVAPFDDADPRRFIFISPSRSKVLFRRTNFLLALPQAMYALRVRQSDGRSWDSYRCDLDIPNGTQSHGGSIRTEDIPDNIPIAPGIRWDKNETVIYSTLQSPAFSFDLKEVCNWK